VVGARDYERKLFGELGFKDVVYSSLYDDPPAPGTALPFPDGAFDLVFVEAVLHHIDKPHQAIFEMVRVSRRSVIICESQENSLAWLMLRTRHMEVYEKSEVRKYENKRGGVNDTAVPNFVYRWAPGELKKVFSSLDASREPWIRVCYAWQAYTFGGLLGRVVAVIGNAVKPSSGNCFALHYDKTKGKVHPWLTKDGDGKFAFVDDEK
jgi:SAM-dependent methyltransferase